MNATHKITVAAIFSGALSVASFSSLASQSGLPSPTDWQAWNAYMAQPSHSTNQASTHTASTGLPHSTDWQAWNAYMAKPNRNMDQAPTSEYGMRLPPSTDWQAWNEYFSRPGQPKAYKQSVPSSLGS